jgi:hypothetical protein
MAADEHLGTRLDVERSRLVAGGRERSQSTPAAGSSTSSRPGSSVVEDNEDITFGHRLALAAPDLAYGSGCP